MTPPAQPEYFLVTKSELDLIKNDCAHPERQFCDGCEYADGEDNTRASGLGCNFEGANAVMDRVLSRPNPAAQPESRNDRDEFWFQQGIKDLKELRDQVNTHNQRGTRPTHEGFLALELKLNMIIKEVMSRPANTASKTCPHYELRDGAYYCRCEYDETHDAIIAAKAREDVLKLLEECDYYNNRNFGKPHPVFSDMIRLVREKPDGVRKHVESLRREVQE